MNKFVLVPETKHRQLLSSSAATSNTSQRELLRSIQRPEQHEMLKRYNLAQEILRDARHANDSEAKMAEYREAMHDFSLLRDRGGGGGRAAVLPSRQAKQKGDDDNDGNDNDGDDGAVNDAVELLPDRQKKNARNLLGLLRKSDNDIVSWSRKGEVSVRGRRLPGTNIVDLVGDVLRTVPSKRTTTLSPQRDEFLTALADANVPETVIKNRAALERYRAIKTGGNASTLDNAVSSTTDYYGSPAQQQKKRKRANGDEGGTAPTATAPTSSVQWVKTR